jgi:hypothetical protein
LAYRSWGSSVALLKCVAHLRGVVMKQISVVEEKNPFTLSLKICPEACWGKRWGRGGSNVSPVIPTIFDSRSVDISFKDDVTVILLLGVSSMSAA